MSAGVFLLGVATGAFGAVLPAIVRANKYDLMHFGDLWRYEPDANLRPWLRWVRRSIRGIRALAKGGPR